MVSEGRMVAGRENKQRLTGRVGLLGGTFDPVHNGHLRLAERVREALVLDSILFIPAARPPHKRNGEITPFDHRSKMVKLAIRDRDDFFVSDIEEDRSGPSYSIDTVMQLQDVFQPEILPVFIIGMDAFAELYTWKDWRKLLDCCDLAVVPRPGFPLKNIERIIAALGDYAFDPSNLSWGDPGFRGKIYPVEMEEIAISSTDLRRQIAAREPTAGLIPAPVAEYIEKNRLYVMG